ncbi:MAG: hypothetical protein ABI193_05870 [Minicystis sp.]
MVRSLRRVGALFLCLAAIGTLNPGCAADDGLEGALFIRQCQAVPSDTCTVTADSSQLALSGGTLDVAFGHNYSCPLLVGNQLVARGDPNKVRVETSRIQITGADVRILDANGDPVAKADGSPQEFFTPTSGFADPGTSTSPGFGLADVVLLDVQTAAKQLVAHPNGVILIAAVTLHGHTLGGNELTSGEWKFPIQVVPRTASCDLSPCVNGDTDQPKPNCREGLDSSVDCRLGCPCEAGTTACLPLGCVGGFCGVCSSNPKVAGQCPTGTSCKGGTCQ